MKINSLFAIALGIATFSMQTSASALNLPYCSETCQCFWKDSSCQAGETNECLASNRAKSDCQAYCLAFNNESHCNNPHLKGMRSRPRHRR